MAGEEELPILWDEEVQAVQALKTGKAAGVDNISAKFIIHSGDAFIDVLPESVITSGNQASGLLCGLDCW